MGAIEYGVAQENTNLLGMQSRHNISGSDGLGMNLHCNSADGQSSFLLATDGAPFLVSESFFPLSFKDHTCRSEGLKYHSSTKKIFRARV